MLSKYTLKYLVFCLVVWLKVRRLHDQCIYRRVLVFYYCISNNLLHEKICNSNVVSPNMPIYFLTKYSFFYIKSKKYLLQLFDFFSFLVFLSLFQCLSFDSCYVKQFLGSFHPCIFFEIFFVFAFVLFCLFVLFSLQYLKKIQVRIIIFWFLKESYCENF